MERALFLRGAAQVLTLRGPNAARRGPALADLGVIEDGSVLMQEGVILAVGPTRRMENLKAARNALEIQVHDKVIMPGFADAGLDIASTQEAKPAKAKKASVLLEESLNTLRSCLHHGTVVAEVRTRACQCQSTGLVTAMRHLARVGTNPVPIRRTWLMDSSDERETCTVNALSRAFAELVRGRLADFVQLDVTEGITDRDEVLMELARQSRLGLKLQWGAPLLEQSASVLTRLRPKTINLPAQVERDLHPLLSALPSILVFTPSHEMSSTNRGEGSVRDLIDGGAAVALGSGYDSRLPTSVSMQMAIALATIRLRLSTEEAISAATINAACALGVGERNGSLEVGKRADLLVMDVPDYRELTRNYGVNHVAMVVRDGTVVFNRMRPKMNL